MNLIAPATRPERRARFARVPAFALAAALAAAGVAVTPGVAQAYTTLPPQTFTAAGAYLVTVPKNATLAHVVALGAAGRDGGSAPENYGAGGAGGSGTQVTQDVPIGQGWPIASDSTLTVTVGAVGGGGPGGSPQYAFNAPEGGLGGAGGGATTIANGDGAMLIIAGGGGGGGGGGNGGPGGAGGTSGAGQATLLDGGIAARGGAYGGACSYPLLLQLGDAGESNGTTFNLGGGGGGGGRGCSAGAGGGSGDHGTGKAGDGAAGGGGGAGGSAAVQNDYVAFAPGTNTGDGSVSISFTVPSVGNGPYSTTVSATPEPVRLGSHTTITTSAIIDATGAPVPYAGIYVEVIAPDGTTIPLCESTACDFDTSKPGLTPGNYEVVVWSMGEFAGTTSFRVLPALVATTTALTTAAPVTTSGGTLSATVRPSSGDPLIPTGTVTFTDGTTPLCDGPVDHPAETPDGKGVVYDCRLDTATAGPHHYNATYSGDDHFAGSSGALDSTVAPDPAATSITLASSPNPAQAGQPVTFTVSVGPAGTTALTGTVTFTDGSTPLAVEPLASDGTAAYTTDTLPAGPHQIVATYSGDGSHTGSASNPLAEQVTPAPTAPGAPDLDAADPADGQVTVAFTPPTEDGGAPITGYTVTASPGGRTASGPAGPLTVTGLTNGTAYTFTVTATNAAGLTSVPSTASAPVTPTAPPTPPAPLAVTTTGSLPAGAVGSPYTADLTATGGTTPYSWSLAPGSALPTGLTLHSDGTIDGTPTGASTGIVTVQATDSARPAQAALGRLQLVVAPAPTRTSLSSSADPALQRQPVTFTARVTAAAGAPVPSGRVRFADGATTLATVRLNRSGVATFTTSSLAVGSHPLTATYLGGAAERASTSAPLPEVVRRVTAGALADQIAGYLQHSPAYARLRPAQQTAALTRISQATQQLARLSGGADARRKAALIRLFDTAVRAAEARRYLTAAQAAALIGEAGAL